MSRAHRISSLTYLLVLLSCTETFALTGIRNPYGYLFTEVLVFVLVIGSVLSPIGSLAILGLRSYKHRRLLKLFNWLTIMAAILLLAAGVSVLNLYALGLGIIYILLAIFTASRYKKLAHQNSST